LRRSDGSLATLSIMMPHNTANPNGPAALQYLRGHVTPVAAIERVTGLDLFPAQPVSASRPPCGHFVGRQPSSLCRATG
jgi:hypothetical protein